MSLWRKFFISTLALILSTSGITEVAADQTRYIDVVSVTWTNAKKSSVTTKEIERVIDSEVNLRWRSLTKLENDSKDRIINFVHGKTLEKPIVLNKPMSCEGQGASSFMNSVQNEAYKQLSISDWGSRYLVILAPNSGCIWMGRALIGSNKYPGGVITLQDTASAFVLTHELGHTLGLGHSNLLRCDSGARDGTWGADCKAVEYGGAIDLMSNVDVFAPLSTYHQWRMGLLEDSEIRQSWLSEEIELGASDVVDSTRAIFLRDGNVTYWVEYRRPNPMSSYKPGLVIYRTDPPPLSSVVSPNPEDAIGSEFSNSVGSDIWMLNWDDYTYARSRTTGSMSLPEGRIAALFSGNIKISASPTESANRVRVSVMRTPDKSPPPPPELVDPGLWQTPNTSIIRDGYRDGESEISRFELDIDGEIFNVESTPKENFSPTYLNPLFAPQTITVKNLPEGDYRLAVRAVDIWGNTGPWSKPVKAFVDRGNPLISSNLELVSINQKVAKLRWQDLKDEGVGLCSTILHNPEGFVVSQSEDKKSPILQVPTGKNSISRAQIFDCLGNGISGDVSISTNFIEASSSKRTGKWSSITNANGLKILKCAGKCSASISLKGDVSFWFGAGTADIYVGGIQIKQINGDSTQDLISSEKISIGPKKKVVRISGRNFNFGGVSQLELKLGQFSPIVKNVQFPDPSLSEPIQKALSELGFNQSDFTSDWAVLPMARGTTLLDPTLDLCSATYASEQDRENRRQISITKVNSPYLFLSSESVKYRTESASENAYFELKKNLDDCIKNRGVIENGIFTKYSFQPISLSNSIFEKGISKISVRATIGESSSSRNLLAFYQFHKSFFTGLYVVTSGDKPLSEAEISRWSEVSNLLANRMIRKATNMN